MAWCHQATSHYLSQCWPRYMCRHTASLDHHHPCMTRTKPTQLWAYLTGPAVLRNWVDKTNKIRLKKVSEFHPGAADMYTTGHVYQCSNINWATTASCPDDNDSSPPSHWNLTIARGLIQSSWGGWHTALQLPSLKLKCCHFDEIFIISCTGSCYLENVRSSVWRKFHQNDISVSVRKSIERHTAHTIVSWPNPKQWVIVHTSDLMMIIRQSIYIYIFS